MSSKVKAVVDATTSRVGALLARSQSLEYFVRKYQESKQRGTNLEFVTEAITRCREAFQSGKPAQQVDCLQEMLFLQMQGHDMTWLEFKIADLLPMEDYSIKLMAYTAASCLWNPDSPVIFMSTNCLARDLTDNDSMKKSLALSLIPQIVTSELAANVVSAVTACFQSTWPGISQKAICCFYQICLKFPEALKPGFAVLNVKAKLEDSLDAGLQQAVLALVCELCIHNSKNFRNLVPTFYKMLSNAASPWILVRVLSLFRMILKDLDTEMADKLAKKLIQPVSEILNTAASASVVLEVIRLICDGPIRSRELITVAAERAQDFIQNSDPNLRYLGLTSMTRLMTIDSKTISRHKDIITSCLESEDPTCVLIAVDLLQAIATKQNIGNFVLNLVEQIGSRPPGYVRDQLVSRVIQMCTYQDYQRITDFEWYMNVLLEIYGKGVQSRELAQQLLAIALRVEMVRPNLVEEMLDIMRDPVTAGADMIETAAFILGEYSTSDAADAFELLLSPKISNIAAAGQSACIHNAFKLYTKASSEEELKKYGAVLLERLPQFSTSQFTEVQERASMLRALVELFQESPDLEAIGALCAVQLKAISDTAQGKVRIPESLDLSSRIVDLTAPEPTFEFLGDDEFGDQEGTSGPNPSIFILSSASKKAAPKPANVMVVKDMGVDVKQAKKRRLVPQMDTRTATLAPIEGETPESVGKEKKPISPLAGIDINTPLRRDERLPEILPYTQEEVSRHSYMLAKGKIREKDPSSIDYENYIQTRSAQGLGIDIFEMKPRANGLEIGISVTNSSQIPISAVEFVLDESAPQCLRTEIGPNETAKHRLLYRSEPLAEPKVVKLTLLPTGGLGETLQARIRLIPTFFLEHGKLANFDAALEQCDQRVTIEIGEASKVAPLVHSMQRVTRGTVVKKEVSGQKIIGCYSTTQKGDSVISVLRQDDGGFVIELGTNKEPLTNSLAVELKKALAEAQE